MLKTNVFTIGKYDTQRGKVLDTAHAYEFISFDIYVCINSVQPAILSFGEYIYKRQSITERCKTFRYYCLMRVYVPSVLTVTLILRFY